MVKKRIIKHIFNFLFLVFFTFENPKAHNGPYIELKSDTEVLEIGHHLEILEDPSRKLTLKEILKPEYQLKFQVSNSPNPNLGLNKSAYWIRFAVKDSDGTKKWILSDDFVTQDHIWFYQKESEEGEYRLIKTGDHQPLSKREIQVQGFHLLHH